MCNVFVYVVHVLCIGCRSWGFLFYRRCCSRCMTKRRIANGNELLKTIVEIVYLTSWPVKNLQFYFTSVREKKMNLMNMTNITEERVARSSTITKRICQRVNKKKKRPREIWDKNYYHSNVCELVWTVGKKCQIVLSLRSRKLAKKVWHISKQLSRWNGTYKMNP